MAFTTTLMTRAAAYNSALEELKNIDDTIDDAEYVDDSDHMGSFVRAFVPGIGYSSKYYYD